MVVEAKYAITSIQVWQDKDYYDNRPALFLIKEREFKQLADDDWPKWYYSGDLLDVESSRFSYCLRFATTLTNARDSITPLEQIADYFFLI